MFLDRCLMVRPFRLLTFAWCALVGVTAHAAILVVNQQDSAASDQNTGTEQQPLKTISAAAVKVQPGDRVIIHQGEYRETVIIRISGTAEKPITFEAAAGETPVIKGSDHIIQWSHEQGAIWKASLPVPPPRNPLGGTAAYWQTNDVRQVFIQDGVLFTAQRLRRVLAREAITEGSFFCDPKASMLYVWLPNSASPVEHPPEASVRGSWLIVNADHIIIRGLQMRHSSTTALANWPACSLNGKGNTLESCTLSWGDFLGVSVSGSSNTLRNCLIACHGDSGIGGTGEKHLVEGCRVVYNNIERYNSSWHAGGAKLIPQFNHGTVRANEFAYNQGPGLWLDGSCDENIIDGNLTHDNSGAGIMVEVSRGNLVLNNISYANRNNLSGPYREPDGSLKELDLSESRISPSRLLKLYHAGEGRGIDISSAPQTKVLYNTCYLNEGEGICVEGPPRLSGSDSVTTDGEIIANNISVFNKGSQLTLHQPIEKEKPAISDHNLLFAVGAVFAKYGWEGPVAMAVPEWQKVSGEDAHSLDTDPRFALAAMDDFRPLAGSPALAAGQPFPEADHDFLGAKRDPTRPTIGAFEHPAQIYPVPAWQSLSSTIQNGRK